jgi:AraC family transcriptional regulator, regulatory protein of adaptative response / methylated-DNA-[protein]-cysteine methyltransferase
MAKLPPIKTMQKAFEARDSAFEGLFLAAVSTTGIFCRPTCSARKPKPENVEFFSSAGEALYAGYRPCKLCKPMDQGSTTSDIVKTLSERLEKSSAVKIGPDDLKKMGIDPSTARRHFQRAYGMTFDAYQRARRIGSALHDIRQGESVIDTQLNHGFESASGFWEAFKNIFGVPPGNSAGVNCLKARWLDTPFGAMLAIASEDGLHMLEFVDRRGLDNELKELRRRTNCVIVPGSNPYLDAIANELERYFAGSLPEFSVPLVLGGSLFEKAVWQELRTIPCGKTRSYAETARRIGNPDAVRVVGRANRRNILAIVVPCHRVIRADGTLCGYGGGVWRKKWLLEHEKSAAIQHG